MIFPYDYSNFPGFPVFLSYFLMLKGEEKINNYLMFFLTLDSTADYISGNTLIDEVTGLHLSGLRCVTVLIGAYSRTTGLPVLGVVNQPFYSSTGESQ